MLPTPRTVLLLLLGLPLAAVPTVVPVAWMAVVAAWVALGLAVAWDAGVLYGLRPRLGVESPRTVPVGGTAKVGVRLEGLTDPFVTARVRSEVSAPLRDAAEAALVREEGLGTVELSLDAPRRGRARIEALWSRIDGPFGLVSRVERHPLEDTSVDVVPDIARVAEVVTTHLGAEPMLGGLKRDPWAGNGSEFESLTGYVQGMDPRNVDWKATARHNALRVRRYHLERRQRVVISLDAGRLMADPIDGLDRIDHGLHTGLALARAALLAGDQVGLHAYAEKPLAFLPPRAGNGQLERMRRAATSLEVRPEETNHVLGLRDLLVRLDRRSFVAVFTEFGDTTTAELMVEVLGQLARKHLVVFVALDDPLVEAPLEISPREPRELASAVVAATLGERRLDVLSRLDALSVHVVHARPGVAAGRVLERYLDVKRKGLLG